MNTDKPQYNTARDFLKIFAIIAMTADHASTVFLNEGSDLYTICQFFGNFTIVIMNFFITQGLRYTGSVLKYAEKLLLWAVMYGKEFWDFYRIFPEELWNIAPQNLSILAHFPISCTLTQFFMMYYLVGGFCIMITSILLILSGMYLYNRK